MMQSSLLLIDTDKPNIRVITRTLRTSIKVIETQPELSNISFKDYDVVLINYDTLTEKDRGKLLTEFSSPEVRQRLVLFSGNPNRADLAQFLAKFGLTNFLARNNEVDPEELYITIHKLISQDIFGVEKYFSWGARSMSKSFRSSQEKKELLEFAGTFAKEAGLQSRFADMFTMVTEELSTNALYDAPTDKEGKHRYAHYSRSQDVTLEQEEEIMATFCCDGRRIGVSVSDPFGSLTPDKILQYFTKFLKEENFFSRFVVNSKKWHQSEIICILDMQAAYSNNAPPLKSFSTFGNLADIKSVPVQQPKSVEEPKPTQSDIASSPKVDAPKVTQPTVPTKQPNSLMPQLIVIFILIVGVLLFLMFKK